MHVIAKDLLQCVQLLVGSQWLHGHAILCMCVIYTIRLPLNTDMKKIYCNQTTHSHPHTCPIVQCIAPNTYLYAVAWQSNTRDNPRTNPPLSQFHPRSILEHQSNTGSPGLSTKEVGVACETT